MDKIEAGRIKEMVLSEGIDLVGIADARELILAYPPRPATGLMPEARSVIVMAVAHSIGASRTEDIKLWTRNKMETSRLLDRTAEKVGRFLESQGFLTLPVSADKPVEIHKRDPQTGKRFFHTRVVGQLSLKHAALSAGMGQMGRSNLLLTPEFGPHQRLGGIITEAVLEPDPFRELDLCVEGCTKCEEACPVGALRNGNYEVDPCFNYWSLGLERMRPRRPGELPAFIRMLYENLLRRDLFIELGQTYITDVDFCIECMKACPVGDRPNALRGDDAL
jgi:epoxyqueuosine reductase